MMDDHYSYYIITTTTTTTTPLYLSMDDAQCTKNEKNSAIQWLCNYISKAKIIVFLKFFLHSMASASFKAFGGERNSISTDFSNCECDQLPKIALFWDFLSTGMEWILCSIQLLCTYFSYLLPGVAIMLSITIFATIVGDMLPVSDATPLIGQHINFVLFGYALFCFSLSYIWLFTFKVL